MDKNKIIEIKGTKKLLKELLCSNVLLWSLVLCVPSFILGYLNRQYGLMDNFHPAISYSLFLSYFFLVYYLLGKLIKEKN